MPRSISTRCVCLILAGAIATPVEIVTSAAFAITSMYMDEETLDKIAGSRYQNLVQASQRDASEAPMAITQIPIAKGETQKLAFEKYFLRRTGVAWSSLLTERERIEKAIVRTEKEYNDSIKLDEVRNTIKRALAGQDKKGRRDEAIELVADYETARRDFNELSTRWVARAKSGMDSFDKLFKTIEELSTTKAAQAGDFDIMIEWSDLAEHSGEEPNQDFVDRMLDEQQSQWQLVVEAAKKINTLLDKLHIPQSDAGRKQFDEDKKKAEGHQRNAEEAVKGAMAIVTVMYTAGAWNPVLIAIAIGLLVYAAFEKGKADDLNGKSGDQKPPENSQPGEESPETTSVPSRVPQRPGSETMDNANIAENARPGKWDSNLGGAPEGIPFHAGWKGKVLTFVFELPSGPRIVSIDMDKENRTILHNQLKEVEAGKRHANVLDIQYDPDGFSMSFVLEGIIPPRSVSGELDLSNKWTLLEVWPDKTVVTAQF